MSGTKIKQRDITDCGAACLCSVSGFYKLALPVAKIRQIACTDQKGTNVRGMIEAAEELGFSAKGVKGEKESLYKIPTPAIAHVIVGGALHHYVVIYKVAKHTVTYMDPCEGEMIKVPMAAFLDIWTGTLILIAPSSDFKTGNFKVSNWKRFWFLIEPHKSVLIQSLVGAILSIILGLASAVYIQKIVDHVLPARNVGLLNLLSIGMLLLILLQGFIGVIRSLFMVSTAQQIDARLVLGYYKHLLTLPQQFFDSMRVGEIMSRIGDAIKIRTFINEVASDLVVSVFTLVFGLVLMLLYSVKLTLILLGLLPIYLLSYYITNRFNKRNLRKIMEESADLESVLVESLNGVETIKRFGVEKAANQKTETAFIKILGTGLKSIKFGLYSSSATGVLTQIFSMSILYFGSLYVFNNELSVGTLLAFNAVIGRFTGPVQSLIGANASVQGALIAADRLFELMDLSREDQNRTILLEPDRLGDIRFENVAFRYGTRVEIFKNLDLTIPGGKTTAIIGESGSGKTTLVSILQNLYPLMEGKVFIGKYDLSYVNLQSLREMVAVVPQKSDLFSVTVKENIALGVDPPDILKISRICERLGILKFIEALPDGFDTHLGERGTALSGGQQQRIAIARALYKEPEILILDEATSHLDGKAERTVYNTVELLREEGKTIILIAHRLGTILNADNVVVLEDGGVVENGPISELMEKDGRFKALWNSQIRLSNTASLLGKKRSATVLS